MLDQKNAERKVKTQRMKELETKKMLDLQKKERQQQHELERFQETVEAKTISKDVATYEQQQKVKHSVAQTTLKSHQDRLLAQIEDKKTDSKNKPTDTFLMSKDQLKEIERKSKLGQ